MIALRKTAEDAMTLTLEWSPVAGATGYRFTAEKMEKPSHTWNASATRVKFAKGSAWYKVEALAVGDAGTYPEASSPGSRAGIATLRYGSASPPPNPERYDLLVSGWDKAPVFGALATKSLHYFSMVTVGSYGGAQQLSVPLAFCQSTDTLLKTASGAPVMNVGYGFPLGDPGSPVYQAEFIRRQRARLLETGVDGLFIDDTQYWVAFMAGGAVPAKYPTQAKWLSDAVVPFARALSDALRPEFSIAYNATGYHDPATEAVFRGDPDLALFEALAPYADRLMCEYWQARPNIPGYVRKSGSGWVAHWDEWMRLPRFCAEAGIDFLANAAISSATARDYVLASLLLEDAGTFVWNTGTYDASADPWNSTYDRVRALGLPTGPKRKNGNRWERPYGTKVVYVDPVAGTASIP